MTRTSACRLILAALLVLGGPALAAGKYYKWVDENGVTHYTLSPPPDGRNSQEVRTWNSASSDQAEALEALEKRRQAAAEPEKPAKPAETGEAEGGSKESKDEFAKRCEQHRENLKVLREQPMVRKQDPETGEAVAIDAEERERLIKQTEESLKGCP